MKISTIIYCLTGTVLFLLTTAVSIAAPSLETVRQDTEFGKVPLSFVLNEGQFDPIMKFVAEGNADSVYELAQQKSNDPPVCRFIVDLTATPAAKPVQETATQNFYSLDLHLYRPNLAPMATGEEPYTWKSNYFFGNDPAQWKTNLPNYRRMLLHDLYPGIDLRYIAKERGITYELIVRAGADPKKLVFRYDYSPAEFEVTSDGVIIRGAGSTYTAPPAYQVIDGKEVPVSLKYKMRDAQVKLIEFEYGEYDPGYDIVIKPEVVFAPYIGVRLIPWVYGMDVDNEGNVYMSGRAYYKNYFSSSSSKGDFFLFKLAPGGKDYGYLSYFGSLDGSYDVDYRVVVDHEQNAIVAGMCYNSSDFTITLNAYDKRISSTSRCFIVKFAPQGNSLVFATFFGNPTGNTLNDLAVDRFGDIYITGLGAFPVTPGAYDVTYDSETLMSFIAKLKKEGDALVYATYLKGGNCKKITVDSTGCAYVGGDTGYKTFPTTSGAYSPLNNGKSDLFVAKLNEYGSDLVYSTYLGGNEDEEFRGIAVDNIGNAYITGDTISKNYPTTINAFRNHLLGRSDITITILNKTGNKLNYSTYWGGGDNESSNDISFGENNTLLVIGNSYNLNYPVTEKGSGNAFVSIFKDNNLIYSKKFNYFSFTNISNKYSNEIFLLGSRWIPDYPMESGLFDDAGGLVKLHVSDITKVSAETIQPSDILILHPFPNPFNAATSIRYTLPEDCRVEVSIFNSIGQKVSVLLSEHQKAGLHIVTWDARHFPSGSYFCQINNKRTRMLLLK